MMVCREMMTSSKCRLLICFSQVTAGLTLLVAGLQPERAGADEMPLSMPRPAIAALPAKHDRSRADITLGFARILVFNQPARTIIIGNPGVIDGTLSDERTIVLTGKAVGTTNMIVLGEAGREIAHLIIDVAAASSQTMTVHHGAEQQVFSCVGSCKTVLPAVNSK
jgi:Flp pilus assembly secretin CpaC